jgi:hypothetical protein
MVKFNDDSLNKEVILSNTYFLTKVDIKTAYMHNRFIFDRLPEEYKQARANEIADFIKDDENFNEVLFSDPVHLISTNKTNILNTYLSTASKAMEERNNFIEELVELKKSKSNVEDFDKKIKNKFNLLFNKVFRYGNIDNGVGSEETGWNVPMNDRDRLLKEFNDPLIDSKRLVIIFNETKETQIKDVLYRTLTPIFIRKFTYDITKISDEVLLMLIPYLDKQSKDLLLNQYNGENQSVIKELLKFGAKFYLNTNSSTSSINFKIFQIDLRSPQRIKNDEELTKYSYDNKKTLIYKLILGVTD